MYKPKRGNGITRERVVDAASLLFVEKGYNGTSMRDLAEVLNIEAASLYNHIANKLDILFEIISEIETACVAHIKEVEILQIPYIEKLKKIISFHVGLMMENYHKYYVSITEWLHLDSKRQSDYVKVRRAYTQDIEKIIQNGIDAGEIKKVNTYLAVLTILSSITGLQYIHRYNRDLQPEEVEEEMITTLINGLSAKNT